MVFSIVAPALAAIREHVVRVYPNEGCGVLVGLDQLGARRVDYAVATRNGEAHPQRRYRIAPEEFLAAERQARARGLAVVGFYHSHPDREPEPSASDAAEAWPHYTYLIVAVRAGVAGGAGAWRFSGDGFAAEPLTVLAAPEGGNW